MITTQINTKIMWTFTKLLFFILLIQTTYSQWISNYSGSPSGDASLSNAHGNAVTVDNNGFCYITGYVNENNGQGNNILIIKYNSETGDTIWVKAFNGTANNDDVGNDIKVDNLGNVYVTGSADNLNTGPDAVLLKYSSEGNLIWAKQYSGDTSINKVDVGNAIAFDGDYNIYVTGYCTNADNKKDIILLRYNSSGFLVWNKKEDGEDHQTAEGIKIAVNTAGNCFYVLGYIYRTATVGDICLIKYNKYGYQYFVKYLSGSGNYEDRAFGIAVDDADYVYITGYTTYDEVNGFTHCVTTKLTGYGDNCWSNVYENEAYVSDRAFGIAVDQEDGAVYIAGSSTDLNGNTNYLTVSYSSNGVLRWEAVYDGPANGDDEASAIGIINNNNTKNIIVVGKSYGTNNNDDYSTLSYSTGGSLLSESRYSMTAQSEDIPKDLAIDSDNNTFITGFSTLLGNGPTNSSAVSTIKLSSFNHGKSLTNNGNPSGYKLLQNYPNPFNPVTNISFTIPYNDYVQLNIYDVTGQNISKLINGNLKAGSYEISFNAQNIASGIYFYELKVGKFRETKKMTLIK